MISRCLRIWRLEKIRFLFIGGLNTAFGMAVFPVLFIVFERYNVHYLIVLILSWFMATTVSFITNRNLVFRSAGGVVDQYVRFIPFHAVILLINLMILPAAVSYLAVNIIFLQMIYTCLVVLMSYFWYKKISFK